jgi:hypothetical protein
MKATRSLHEIDHEIGLFEAGRAALRELRRTYEQRLRALEALPVMERLASADKLNDLRMTLSQIDRGVESDEGADSDVWNLLIGPLITSLRMRAPGLEPIERVLDTMRAERAEAEERERTSAAATSTAPRCYRYTGRPGGHVMPNGRGLEPGDVVELNQRAASVLADRFELVVEDKVSATEAAGLKERVARAEAQLAQR